MKQIILIVALLFCVNAKSQELNFYILKANENSFQDKYGCKINFQRNPDFTISHIKSFSFHDYSEKNSTISDDNTITSIEYLKVKQINIFLGKKEGLKATEFGTSYRGKDCVCTLNGYMVWYGFIGQPHENVSFSFYEKRKGDMIGYKILKNGLQRMATINKP